MIFAALLALAGVLAPQAQPGDLAARWMFDGDVKDVGPASLPTKAVGRIEFLDSPVAGRLAVLNGIDAYVQIDPPGKLGAGSGDFTLTLWAFALDRRPSTLVARKGWSLSILEGGILKFASPAGDMISAAGAFPAGQWHHVAVSVKREITPSGLFIDGDLAAGNTIATKDLDGAPAPLYIGRAVEEGRLFTGLIDDVRLYAQARQDVAALMDEGIPWLRPKPHAKTPFAGKFELLQDDVVLFTGGENTRVGQDLGFLETLVALHASGKRVHCRNVAWEGDTVYEQPRPLNFGSWSEQLRRSGATVVFAQFGQVEALEGKAGVDRFISSYESLIAQFSKTTQRIVLVSPTPFGKGSARQPDLLAKNEDLKLYVDAIRKLAAKNSCLFIDLSTKSLAQDGLTRDGLHLTVTGQWIAAKETARQLEIPGMSDLDSPSSQGVFPRESYEKIRTALRAKNMLWNEWWRPTNWAFLNGDRMEQPSSRDHVDRRVRWFPVEVQQLPAMLRREEDKIEALLQAEKK